jgi:hypothetical protein
MNMYAIIALIFLYEAGFALTALAPDRKNAHFVQSAFEIKGGRTAQLSSLSTRMKNRSVTPTTIYAVQSKAMREVDAHSTDAVYRRKLGCTSNKPIATAVPAVGLNNYMAVIDEWRIKMGLQLLVHDLKLQSNAMDTVSSSNGAMTHKLNPGTFAQVLAPGNDYSFMQVFVGGWLCELPSLVGLGSICASLSEGWVHNGQTRHAEILTSDAYSKIGCAFKAGIWACDLA